MASGPAFGFGLPPGLGLRRSVVDPITGQPVVTSAPTGAVKKRGTVLPIGQDDDGRLVPAVPGMIADAPMAVADALTLPRDAWNGAMVTQPTAMSQEEGLRIAEAAGLAMTGSLPSAMAGALGRKGVASRTVPMYDPPPRAARPFEKDYPPQKWPDASAYSDASGRLTHDIDGRSFARTDEWGGRTEPRYVVGRRVVGGEDQALTAAELDGLAEAITGARSQGVAPRGGGLSGPERGAYLKRRGARVEEWDRAAGSERPFWEDGYLKSILLDRSLPQEASGRVLGHEVGHAIDDIVGNTVQLRRAVPFRQLDTLPMGETGPLYTELNRVSSPQAKGYPAADAPAELNAEAFRAYMADPNAMKEGYPTTAARIREVVNSHPALSPYVQFNSGGKGGAPLGLAVMAEAASRPSSMRRLTYDSPLIGKTRLTQVEAESRLANRRAKIDEPDVSPEYATLYREDAAALEALLPKFAQESFPRGRPFEPWRQHDMGDGRVVRVEDAGDGQRIYRIHERREDGSLSRPRGDATVAQIEDGRWRTGMLEVKPRSRGKGMASTLYDALERDTGQPRVPSGQLLPDGYAFWQKRDPAAVQYHQPLIDQYFSPRSMLGMLDSPIYGPEFKAELRAALDRVPPEGKTPEALAAQFYTGGPGGFGPGLAPLALPDETPAPRPAFGFGPSF